MHEYGYSYSSYALCYGTVLELELEVYLACKYGTVTVSMHTEHALYCPGTITLRLTIVNATVLWL